MPSEERLQSIQRWLMVIALLLSIQTVYSVMNSDGHYSNQLVLFLAGVGLVAIVSLIVSFTDRL
ncbi:hypothetical protein ACFQJC_03525 [Haloferax namakaokahaiae]|uniref:Uncharacterized protein n=1 Tax=Haloferax namakaokahaiae TaxID=1748331 RepID=A0ABD5ZBX9_9EURY